MRFRLESADWLLLRTYHDGYKDFAPVSLFNLTDDPHEQHDLSAVRADVVGHAERLLEAWHGEMMFKSETDIDPLMTVMREGGPYHTRGELPAYLARLRATGRADAATALEARHPAPPPRQRSLN